MDFGLSVKDRETELLVSCNLIVEDQQPLDLRPWSEAPQIVNCGVVSPTLIVNPTLFVIPCKFVGVTEVQLQSLTQ